MISALLPNRPHYYNRSDRKRKGIANVEFVLGIQLSTAVMFAAFEICSAVFLKEAPELSAFKKATTGEAFN